jgi:PKD repeat protein
MTTLMASVVTGDDVSYTWAFGDGDTGSGANTTHTYPDVGVYTAVVTATNSVSTVTATTVVTIEQDTWTIYLPVVVDQDGNAKQAAQPPPLSLKRYWR